MYYQILRLRIQLSTRERNTNYECHAEEPKTRTTNGRFLAPLPNVVDYPFAEARMPISMLTGVVGIFLFFFLLLGVWFQLATN